MLQVLSISLALLSSAAGLVAAWFWYRSSQVPAVPPWAAVGGIEPGDPDLARSGWIAALLESTQEAGRLNKVAALWTAASVALGVAAVVAQAFA
jgi:hypothetical protein